MARTRSSVKAMKNTSDVNIRITEADDTIVNNENDSIRSINDSDSSDNNLTTTTTHVPEDNDVVLKVDVDYVGELKKSATSPALANDFLTAHNIFGDYIRKHEIPRKVFHSSIGFITLYLFSLGLDKADFVNPLLIAFIIIFSLDLIRLNWKDFNYLYCQVVGFLMREKEITSFNGVLWYIAGCWYLFKFYSDDIAIISILLLSWCDTSASTIGRKYGYLTPKIARNKSLAGSLAAFLVGMITCFYFYGIFIPKYNPINPQYNISWNEKTSYLNLTTMSILSGFVAALSEGIDLFNWDDNFTIPLLSGFFLKCVITIFHK